MSLQDLSSLVSIVSGFAVALSLLYLTFQIRQSAKHQRGTISHGRAEHVQQLMQSVAECAPLMDVVLRGYRADPTLDRVQCNQFYWFVSAIFIVFQDTFQQHQEGMISARVYDSAVRTMTFQMSQPGTRAVWLLGRTSYDAEFVAFMDGLMRATPCAATGDVAERWKALAAEQAAAAG